MDAVTSAKIAAVAAALGLALAVVLIPVVRYLAHCVGLVDRPDPTRKLHRGDIALGGGLAVLIASLAAIALVHALAANAFGIGFFWSQRWYGLALGAVAIVALGLVDDRFALRGRQKLLGQIAVAVGVAVAWDPSGQIQLLGWHFDVGAAAVPIVVVWLLASINAVNLIDGADGVASTVGAAICGAIALLAVAHGHILTAVAAASLAASLVGFLGFNRPPASIFLGDAGSMLIGLVGGTLACWAVESPTHPLPLLIPIALLGVPLFDSVTAIVRRVLTGRSIYMPDRGHLHHIVADYFAARRRSPLWMLVVFAALCSVTSAGAVAGSLFDNDLAALLGIAIVVGGLVCTRIFGHAEARLLVTHGKRMGGALIARPSTCQEQIHVAGIALQGNRQWENVWAPLVEFAQTNGVWRLQLDLNIAWQHEGYHGFWSRGRLPDKEEQWSMRLPIVCDRRAIGRLEIIGQAGSESEYQSLETFTHLLGEMQPAIDTLVYTLRPVQLPAVSPPPPAAAPSIPLRLATEAEHRRMPEQERLQVSGYQ